MEKIENKQSMYEEPLLEVVHLSVFMGTVYV